MFSLIAWKYGKPFFVVIAVQMLTYQMPVLPSCRNQSIDLHSISLDWFLRAALAFNGSKFPKFNYINPKKGVKYVQSSKKAPERRYWRGSCVVIVSFENILCFFLMFLMLT